MDVQVVFRRGRPAPEASGAHVGRSAQSPARSAQTENRRRLLEDNRTRVQTRTRREPDHPCGETRDPRDELLSSGVV